MTVTTMAASMMSSMVICLNMALGTLAAASIVPKPYIQLSPIITMPSLNLQKVSFDPAKVLRTYLHILASHRRRGTACIFRYNHLRLHPQYLV